MSNSPARAPDIRVGSSTYGLEPVSLAERKLSAGAPHWLALGAIAGSAILADQLTKHVVTTSLALGEETDSFGPLSIHHVQNTGIAFGLFGGATALVTAFTALAVAWMLYFFARSAGRHGLLPVALGFLIGGSGSNLVDRLRLGHVTDFLDLAFWPAFNLADTFIVVGVVLLVTALFASDASARKGPRPRPATGPRPPASERALRDER